MIFVFVIQAPGSDMDGEPFEIESTSRDEANERAARRVKGVFVLASAAMRASARAVHVATFDSKAAHKKAQAAAYESGVALTDPVGGLRAVSR